MLTAFEPPTGPGVRTDTFGYAGYRTSPRYDALLAKVIVHADGGLADAARAADDALREFRIAGPATNIGFLRAILRHPEFAGGRSYTRFVDDHVTELLAAEIPPARHAGPPLGGDAAGPGGAGGAGHAGGDAARTTRTALAGAAVDPLDPLAVLEHGKRPRPDLPPPGAGPAGTGSASAGSAGAGQARAGSGATPGGGGPDGAEAVVATM
ncbi:MAG TPA: hypothetical protein VFX25_13755, partial [Streptosporangiaceae bacterium]|nr:hypothetical protein [Streptosporangiaceae bacterium]